MLQWGTRCAVERTRLDDYDKCRTSQTDANEASLQCGSVAALRVAVIDTANATASTSHTCTTAVRARGQVLPDLFRLARLVVLTAAAASTAVVALVVVFVRLLRIPVFRSVWMV
jgi:hypothetical protein